MLNDFETGSSLKSIAIPSPGFGARLKLYRDLSKAKLSLLVASTSLVGFLVVPGLNFGLAVGSICGLKYLCGTLFGTMLCSFSANSLNQWMETPFDAQMKRTCTRPLPSHLISPPHAFYWALVCGIAGSWILVKVSLSAAFLAVLTIFLYAGIYTPMKRISTLNTMVGALVGALPPLIGWFGGSALLEAEYGQLFSMFDGWMLISSAVLPLILFIWQFPHFYSLSWLMRKEYSKAGYVMECVVNPTKTVLLSFIWSLSMVPISYLAVASELVNPFFLLSGNMVNCVLIFNAWRFYRKSDNRSAKRLFFTSLIHLPLLMGCLIFHKNKQ